MKLASLFVLIFSFAVGAQASGSPATTHSYFGQSRFEAPLDTYSRCAEGTWAGESARESAEQEALAACNEAYNSDCVVAGAHFRTIISREFMGYKACEVTVLVHGYRLGR